MTRRRTDDYIRTDGETVERDCEHCDWQARAGTYPELIERYQDHLRAEHPRAWLRT